jgi:hypothetical protein
MIKTSFIEKRHLPIKKPDYRMWQSGYLQCSRKSADTEKTRDFPPQSHNWFGFFLIL